MIFLVLGSKSQVPIVPTMDVNCDPSDVLSTATNRMEMNQVTAQINKIFF